MTDFHDLQLKEQLLLQQKWEDDVDVDEGNVCDLCVRSVKPNKFFDKTPVAAHQDEPGQRDDSSSVLMRFYTCVQLSASCNLPVAPPAQAWIRMAMHRKRRSGGGAIPPPRPK